MRKHLILFVAGGVVGAIAYWVVLLGDRDSAADRAQAATPATISSELSASRIFDSEAQRSTETSDDEALAALAQLEHSAALRSSALALLDVLGKDEQAISRVAVGLPEIDRGNFTFDAIAAVAANDPAHAIELTLALRDLPARSEALRRVATVLGNADPRAALGYISAIQHYELVDVFTGAVLEAWAANDPGGFLAYIESAPALEARVVSDALAVAAAIEPGAVLGIVDRMHRRLRSTVERAALDVLMLTDTSRALAYLASLPPGNASNSLHRAIGQSYAKRDLDAALTWADTLRPPSSSALTGVLLVLAKVDPVRAADIVVDKLEAGRGPNADFNTFEVFRAFTPGPPELLARVAERLNRSDSAAVQPLYLNFLSEWAQHDPDSVHDWALADPGRLTGGTVTAVAQVLAGSRPQLAKLTADRLPSNLRGAWITAVARGLAEGNLADALQWMSRYEGQPYHREALAAALHSASLFGRLEDPAALASFLDRQSVDARADSVSVVANAWAERDPAAAARWVEQVELSDITEERRLAALSNVAARWAAQNAEEAEDWALRFAGGPTRDRALGAVLTVTSEAGRVETRLLRAFSSDAVAQQRLAGLMANLGNSNPDLGRELIDRYIADPVLRTEAERELAQGSSSQLFRTGSRSVF
jgi:CRP-like cAMP-binding protein